MELSDWVLEHELDGISTLLINPVNGAIDIMPTKFFEDIPDSGKEHLSERGYFLSESERLEKIYQLQAVYEQHSKNVPYWFYVLTTLNCNFECPICYEKLRDENTDKILWRIENDDY